MPALSVPALPVSVLPEAACGVLACGDAVRGRAGRAQHAADRGFRHPRRGGDRGLAGAVAVQLPDPLHDLRGQLRGPLRSLDGRDQARDPAAGQRLRPPPHAHRDHPERLRHLHLRRGLQLDELDRRQPPRRLIARIPRERGQPVHPHHAAAVRAADHAHPRGYLRRVVREKRQRHLGQHPGHHPTPASDSKPFIYYCGNVAPKQARGTGKGIKDQISRPATPRNQAAMSGALSPLRSN